MKAWHIALFGLTCLAAAGCRTDPAKLALERENRDLEDRIYDLKDDLQKAEDALEKCRRESKSARKGGRASTQIESPSEPGRSPRAGGPELGAPRSSREAAEAEDETPHIYVETPSKPLPKGKLPETLKTPVGAPRSSQPGEKKRQDGSKQGEAPKFTPGTSPAQGPGPGNGGEPLPEPRKLNVPGASGNDKSSQTRPRPGALPWAVPVGGTAIVPGADSSQVDRITLNRLLFGGWDMDGRPGDEGVLLLVEPRDTEGRLVAAAAPLSVVVLDRGLAGPAARVARWDSTGAQVSTLFRSMPTGDGIYLELPWPGTPPVHSHLHLFVRYTTRDGRKLEANRELDIALANQAAQQNRTLDAGLSTSEEREVGIRNSDSPTSKSVRSQAASWQAKPLPKEPAASVGQVANLPHSDKDTGPDVVSPAGDGTATSLVREETTPDPVAASVGQVANLPHNISARGAVETPIAPNRAADTPSAANRPVWSPYRR